MLIRIAIFYGCMASLMVAAPHPRDYEGDAAIMALCIHGVIVSGAAVVGRLLFKE